jgi:hypothetical protein
MDAKIVIRGSTFRYFLCCSETNNSKVECDCHTKISIESSVDDCISFGNLGFPLCREIWGTRVVGWNCCGGYQTIEL